MRVSDELWLSFGPHVAICPFSFTGWLMARLSCSGEAEGFNPTLDCLARTHRQHQKLQRNGHSVLRRNGPKHNRLCFTPDVFSSRVSDDIWRGCVGLDGYYSTRFGERFWLARLANEEGPTYPGLFRHMVGRHCRDRKQHSNAPFLLVNQPSPCCSGMLPPPSNQGTAFYTRPG